MSPYIVTNNFNSLKKTFGYFFLLQIWITCCDKKGKLLLSLKHCMKPEYAYIQDKSFYMYHKTHDYLNSGLIIFVKN